MTKNSFDLWVYLSASPLLWLVVTLGIWLLAGRIAAAAKQHPVVNPVLISIVCIAALLTATGTPYGTFFAGAKFIHFLLGPATVALAIPIVQHWALVRQNVSAMAAALLCGSLTAIGSAVALGTLFGLPHAMIVSLAPKSITAAVAMGISSSLGGDPALTAVLVISTGIIGAVVVTPMMNALGIKNYAARGFAVGLSSHGIGTARAFVVSPLAGLFAGIAMALNAVLTAILIPLFF